MWKFICLTSLLACFVLAGCDGGPGEGEGDQGVCDECETDADCEGGLTCEDFLTGPDRCVTPSTKSCTSYY